MVRRRRRQRLVAGAAGRQDALLDALGSCQRRAQVEVVCKKGHHRSLHNHAL